MRNVAAAVSVGFFLGASALAAIQPYPASFGTENVITNGTQIYVRVGGAGPAVVLLHGYGETGDMWAPLAAQLARDHLVIVPDLRGVWAVLAAGRRLRQKEPSGRRGWRTRFTEDR